MSQAADYITVVETGAFIKAAGGFMSDEERGAFIEYISQNPESGVMIPGTLGVRKVRWGIGDKGKSGGARIIYYYHNPLIPVFLLTAYAKNQKTNLSETEKKLIRTMVRNLCENYQPANRTGA